MRLLKKRQLMLLGLSHLVAMVGLVTTVQLIPVRANTYYPSLSGKCDGKLYANAHIYRPVDVGETNRGTVTLDGGSVSLRQTTGNGAYYNSGNSIVMNVAAMTDSWIGVNNCYGGVYYLQKGTLKITPDVFPSYGSFNVTVSAQTCRGGDACTAVGGGLSELQTVVLGPFTIQDNMVGECTGSIIMYDDINFAGRCQGFNDSTNYVGDFINDKTSSIVVNSGTWDLFLDADYQRKIKWPIGIGRYGWIPTVGLDNDAISSIKLQTSSIPTPTPTPTVTAPITPPPPPAPSSFAVTAQATCVGKTVQLLTSWPNAPAATGGYQMGATDENGAAVGLNGEIDTKTKTRTSTDSAANQIGLNGRTLSVIVEAYQLGQPTRKLLARGTTSVTVPICYRYRIQGSYISPAVAIPVQSGTIVPTRLLVTEGESWSGNPRNPTGTKILYELATDSDSYQTWTTAQEAMTDATTGARMLDLTQFPTLRGAKSVKLRATLVSSVNKNVSPSFHGFVIYYKIQTPPSVPANLRVNITTREHGLVLYWTDTTSDETGFKIERRLLTQTTQWSIIKSVPTNATTFIDANLPDNTTYVYRVRAVTNVGESDPSNEATGTTVSSTPPSSIITPTNPTTVTVSPTATPTPATSVTPTANPSVSPIASPPIVIMPPIVAGVLAPTDLNIQYVTSNAIYLIWKDWATNETGYLLERSQDSSKWSVLASSPANTVQYIDRDVLADTTYYYRVTAIATNTRSNSSGPVASRTTKTAVETNTAGTPTAFSSPATTLVTPPAAPTKLKAQANSKSEVIISWQNQSADETGFRIERRLQGTRKIWVTERRWRWGRYRLVTVSKRVPYGWEEVASAMPNTTSYTDRGLGRATGYEYRVFATNEAGDSDPSKLVRVTTRRR